MAIQTVKTGAAVNDGTGDDARTSFTKINQNFTDSANAASRLVGTAAGNVMEVGAFGIGQTYGSIDTQITNPSTFYGKGLQYLGLIGKDSTIPGKGGVYTNTLVLAPWFDGGTGDTGVVLLSFQGNRMYSRASNPDSDTWGQVVTYLSTANTTVDGNGFIKAASPVVKLFADKIELNDEAAQQDITFEKLGVGDYLIKGSTGFAQEGWRIETPKDANGNVLVAAIYEQLDNNDISVKTYAKKFDEETGDIVANTAKPRDIPATRWIDLRLQELPQPTQPLSEDETVNTNAE